MLVLIVSLLCLASCSGEDASKHVHVFGEATCTSPATCECGKTNGEPLGHKYQSKVTDPTCTEKGYTTYTCACGDTYKGDEVAAKGHEYESVVTAPTCTEKGYTTYTCACGDTYKGDEVAATGHKHVAKVTAPTCTKKGYTTYTCACGDTYKGDEVAATGHKHVAKVTAPTCTKKGYTTYTCACGDTYKGDEVAATGHKHVAKVTAPTCTKKGYTTYTCACGDTYKGDEVAAKGHKYESEVTAPTCTVDGYTTYTCACGDTYKDDEVKAVGHSYDEGVVTKPTCNEKGYTTYTCSCGHSYKGDEVASSGHKYESIVTPPTCTEEGYTTYTCFCGDSYKGDEVKANGHKFINGNCACGEEYVPAPTGTWTQVTELKNGDRVLIGAPAYNKLLSALKVNASSYYNKGVDYTADDFTNVTDAEIFVVKVNDDGSYTFTSITGDVIALASSYSSLNKDGEHKSWTLTSNGDGTFLVFNTGRNTYLEWYNSKGNWSTFTSGNTDEYHIAFYAIKSSAEEHVHNYITSVTNPTCTEDGYTTFTCECGETYTEDGEKSSGHKYDSEVTAPTCSEDGYTTYTCFCGDTYTKPGEKAAGHSFADGVCGVCGAEDPEYHVHDYNYNVTCTSTCTVAGQYIYTCKCGDSYSEDAPIAEHVDTNLDITCDFDGCTKRILPPADSKVSLFTANNMIIVSLSSNYYVEGVVIEISDKKNGVFVIQDEAGDTILVRLPKNADGISYSSFTEGKVVVGDTVQLYGKPTRNTSTTSGQAAKIESAVLTVLKHEHDFSEATCTLDGVCDCGKIGDLALDHADENNDGACDRCGWNMNIKVEDIAISTDGTTGGVLDEGQTFWTWDHGNFAVEISKGSSTFTIYKTSKAYMQLKKQNNFKLYNKNGATISYVSIRVTNATQLENLKKAIGTQYEFTADADALTLTIQLNITGDFEFSNVGTSTVYISGIEVAYVKPAN
jgi:hypothetical protein